MNTSSPQTASQKLAGIVERLRLRVETAESRRRAAKEQVRVAKLRRKEAKLVARRARKQAKQAKAILASARKALAEAEAKLVDSGVRQATRKPSKAKARRVANPSVPASNPVAVTGRKGPSSRPPVASLARRAAVEVAPASLRENTPSPAPAQAGSATGKPDSGPLQPAVTGGTTSSDMRTK
jgi:hypothetical protein